MTTDTKLEPGESRTLTLTIPAGWLNPGGTEEYEVLVRRAHDGVYWVEGFNHIGVTEALEKELGILPCAWCRKMSGGGRDVMCAFYDPDDALGASLMYDGTQGCKHCGMAEGLASRGGPISFDMMRLALANAIEEGRRMQQGLNLLPYTGFNISAEGDLLG